MSNHESRKLQNSFFKEIDVGILVAAVAAIVLLPIIPELPTLDFECFWQSAADLWHGTNPYLSTTRVLSLNSPIGLGLLGFCGVIPYPVAKQLYLFFMLFALLWSIWVGYKKLWVPSNNEILNIALLVIAIPFGIFFQIILWGSMIIFPVLGISAFYCIDFRKHAFLAGCCLSLCLIKPHLFVLVAVWMSYWSIKNRNLLLPAGFITVCVFSISAALYLQSDIFHKYLSISSNSLFTTANASAGNLLYRIVPHKDPIVLFIPLLAGIGILTSLKSRLCSLDLPRASAIVMPWSILLSPYCWGHDYWACFGVLFIAASVLHDSCNRRKIAIAALLGVGILTTFTFSWILRFSPISENFILIGILLAGIAGIVIIKDTPLGVRGEKRSFVQSDSSRSS